MDAISATKAKQRFGEMLGQVGTSPVAIQKHGKTLAMLVGPSFIDARMEMRVARAEHALVEQALLEKHHRIALTLLADPSQAVGLIADAKAEVARWVERNLCSSDYIDRWAQNP